MRTSLLLLALLLSGCDGPLVTFTTQLKAQASLDGCSLLTCALNVFPQMVGFANLDFDSNQDFQNNNAQKQHVKTAKVTSFTLKISAPNDQDYAFLDSLSFAVASDGTETQLAYKDDIAGLGLKAPNPTLVLELPGEDIAHHIRADQVSFLSSGRGRQPANDTTIEASVTLLVGVGF